MVITAMFSYFCKGKSYTNVREEPPQISWKTLPLIGPLPQTGPEPKQEVT